MYWINNFPYERIFYKIFLINMIERIVEYVIFVIPLAIKELYLFSREIKIFCTKLAILKTSWFIFQNNLHKPLEFSLETYIFYLEITEFPKSYEFNFERILILNLLRILF